MYEYARTSGGVSSILQQLLGCTLSHNYWRFRRITQVDKGAALRTRCVGYKPRGDVRWFESSILHLATGSICSRHSKGSALTLLYSF